METFSALLAIVREIHRSPVISPHKGQWRGTLIFILVCAQINGHAGDLKRHRAHYDVIVMYARICGKHQNKWTHNHSSQKCIHYFISYTA